MTEMLPISRFTWDMKYRLKEPDGTPIDKTIEDTWHRIAKTLASGESEPQRWEKEFYRALEGFKFLPGGRIIAGAGSGRDVTLFNCFVMGTIPDDMGGIFSHLREAALTMQQGGGIGYDFSTLRPKGALVKGVGADASGPLPFMDVWDAMCRTVMSAGYRRGAMMATMACDHPDIEAFIEAKREPGRLRMFNLSVLVTDAFMEAIAADQEWPLSFGGQVFKVIKARELWDKIMRATYAYAEPGVIFIDRINRRNNLWYCEKISATNPCGEEPLPPYGNCLLGSLNLAALIEHPFTPNAQFSDKWIPLVRIAVRMLDNVIGISKFPLAQQLDEAQQKRRIGLGITGVADALAMCGLRYGSPAAVGAIETWLSTIEIFAYQASADLAAEKGAFPLFDRERYLAGETIAGLPPTIRGEIASKGMRNSHLQAIAPTGTISLLAGNIANGIEPIFNLGATERKFLMPDGSYETRDVYYYAVEKWRELHGDTPLPDYFVDAQTISPDDHLAMLAAAQKHVDTGISKTINLPENIEFEAFKEVYRKAYDMGCKSCTTYRPNEVTGAVLTVKKAEAPAVSVPVIEEDGVVRIAPAMASPDEVDGRRYRIHWPDTAHALYVIMTHIEVDGRKRPWEIFLVSNEAEADEWRVALGRMISAVFRRGGDVAFVAKELQAIFDKKGGAYLGGKRFPSLISAIGDVIERHMREIGFLPKPEAAKVNAQLTHEANYHLAHDGTLKVGMPATSRLRQCPQCGRAALIRQENCDQCTVCDYSKC